MTELQNSGTLSRILKDKKQIITPELKDKMVENHLKS